MNNFLLSMLVFLAIAVSAEAAPLDIAHRGYAAKNPESTLAAFDYAIAQGADGLELDIRQSADKVLLVTHEPVIAALGNQRVENTPSKQAFLHSDILSLEELIIIAKRFNKPLWIEIKQSQLYPGIIQNLINLLSEHDYLHNVVIQSFNHRDLQVIHTHNPKISLLALYTSGFSFQKIPAFVDWIGLPLSPAYNDANLISAVHQLGKRVIFWRQNSAFENAAWLRQFTAIGADGFMLDRPLHEILQIH